MPALTVGELAVELEARTREFSAKLRDAEHRISGFESKANRSTKAAGLSFRSLIGPIAAVGAAIAALGVTRGLIGIQRSAIQSAAAFEGYEVRLKALLGSQEAANRSLDTFLTLSSKTPFGLAQIVGGAATLASVARGSRTELEDLTQVTANLAAVTGLKFEEAAGNLQRALSAGIGAADLFRDRGVRKLIEEVNGIPDLTKVSLDELRVLFKRTFEPGSLSGFGEAAIDLSNTLAGSLSNIGDAAERFRIALGQALSPGIIATARGLIIPFFDELTGQIQDNEEALARFFIEGFAKGAEVLARVVRGLGPFGEALAKAVNWIRDLKDEAKIAFEAVGLVVKAIGTGLNVLGTGLNAIGTGLRVVSYLLGLRTAEEVEEQFLRLNASVEATGESALALNRAMANFGKEGPEAVRENETAFDQLADRIAATSGEIRRIGDEQILLAKKRAAAEDEADVAARRRRAAIEAEIAAINAEFDEIDREWNEQILTGQITLDTASLEDASPAIQGIFTDAFNRMLGDVARGEGVQGFAETFSDLTSELFEQSMGDAIASLAESFQDAFSDVFSGLGEAFSQTGFGQWLGGLGGGGEGGGFNWGAGLGALAGLGGKVLSGALRGTESSIRNELVQSAVTSTQAVRGIVAGPTSIPIAQVGNAIRDAMAGQLLELRRGNTLLGAILEAIRGLELGGAETPQDLAAAIAAEFNGSVALG